MEKNNYNIERYTYLREHGFTAEKLKQVLEISPRIESIIWIDLFWIYAVLTIAIIFVGNKRYSYCRKARVELCRIIKKISGHK